MKKLVQLLFITPVTSSNLPGVNFAQMSKPGITDYILFSTAGITENIIYTYGHTPGTTIKNTIRSDNLSRIFIRPAPGLNLLI